MNSPITVEALVKINEFLTGTPCTEERHQKLKACLSSFAYYDKLEEQAASIILSLLKGHFFVDGNKRTALAAYLDLAQNNNLNIVSDRERLGELFIELAKGSNSVPGSAEILFPAKENN